MTEEKQFADAAQHVFYADEYLAAVVAKRLPSSPGWDNAGCDGKTIEGEKALRNGVIAANYLARLQKVVANFISRIEELQKKLRETDKKLAPAPIGDACGRKRHSALRRQRGQILEELAYLNAALAKIYAEHGMKAQETLVRTNERFNSRQLAVPTAVSLCRAECRRLAAVAAHMAGGDSDFMPLALRENFILAKEKTISRDAVENLLDTHEKADPGLFRQILVSTLGRDARLAMRLNPAVVILPSLGVEAVCCQARDDMDPGLLAAPLCCSGETRCEQQITSLLADYRWDTALKLSGAHPLDSDSLAGAFLRLRRDWDGFAKEKRERGLVFSEQSAKINWRRIYDLYVHDAHSGGESFMPETPNATPRSSPHISNRRKAFALSKTADFSVFFLTGRLSEGAISWASASPCLAAPTSISF